MAELRIRIELHRADKGIEMPQLVDLANEAQKFLRFLAEDTGISPTAGAWVAEDFYNQGLGFDGVYKFDGIDTEQVRAFLLAADNVTRVSGETGWKVNGVRPVTIVQCARLAKVAKDGEWVRLGFLRQQDNAVEHWRTLEKPRAQAVIEHYEATVEYRGMIQGLIHSIYKEANPPYFTLRDFASRELVRCEFSSSEWPSLHTALERKDGVVLVAGWLRVKRFDKTVEVMRVERIRPTLPLSRDDLRSFFGAAPGWTGDMTTDEFINSIRADGDE